LVWPEDYQEAEANRNLIAAAPEMVQRLREAEAWLREIAKDFRQLDQPGIASGCETRANNAAEVIRKAKGKA
jgi:hypothetical protein